MDADGKAAVGGPATNGALGNRGRGGIPATNGALGTRGRGGFIARTGASGPSVRSMISDVFPAGPAMVTPEASGFGTEASNELALFGPGKEKSEALGCLQILQCASKFAADSKCRLHLLQEIVISLPS